jgi:hypothetical protein
MANSGLILFIHDGIHTCWGQIWIDIDEVIGPYAKFVAHRVPYKLQGVLVYTMDNGLLESYGHIMDYMKQFIH